MRKFAIVTATAAMIAGLGVNTAAAHGEGGWHPHNDRREGRASEIRRHAPQIEVVRAGLHRRYHNEAIPLRRLLDLDSDYSGYRVKSVTVKLRPQQSRGRLSLIANGRVVDSARSRGSRYIELKPGTNRSLDHDLRRFQLAVRGRAHIQSIYVKLRAPRHAHRPVMHTDSDGRDLFPEIAEQAVRIVFDRIDVSDRRR